MVFQPLIPAQAGIQGGGEEPDPAFAGMSGKSESSE